MNSQPIKQEGAAVFVFHPFCTTKTGRKTTALTMGLVKSFKSTKLRSGASEEHQQGGDDTAKVETVTAVRETSKVESDLSSDAQEAEDESKYPTGPKLWVLVLGLCLAIWVVALDNTIIATASKSIDVVAVLPD